MFLDTTTEICDKWFIALGLATFVIFVFGDITMMLRVYALYGARKKVGWRLAAFAVCMAVTSLLFFLLGNRNPTPDPGGIEHGCHPKEYPRLSIGSLIPALITALTMFTLTAVKVFKTFKLDANIRTIKGTHPLVRLLFEQSLLYTSGILAIYTLLILMLFLAPPSIAGLFLAPATATTSFLSARLLLHLKREVSFTNHPNETLAPFEARLRFGEATDSTELTSMRSTTVENFDTYRSIANVLSMSLQADEPESIARPPLTNDHT